MIGTVEVGDEWGFNIVFDESATPALVQLFLRSLTYVSASPADFIDFNFLEIAIMGSDGSENYAYISVTTAPDDATIFTPGMDDIVGTAGADVFEGDQLYIGLGDKLDGGQGDDIFRLKGDGDTQSNDFILEAMTSITGIETIEGSDEDDFIGINATDLAHLKKLDGKGGADTLVLFGANVSVDLSNTDITGISWFALQDDGLNITVDNFETAELINGSLSANDVLNVTTVEITQAQRLELHRHGIDTVTAVDSIDHIRASSRYLPVQVTGLDGDHVAPNGNYPVYIDSGRDVIIAAQDYIRSLEVHMDSPASNDTTKLAIDVSGSIKLSRGMFSGSVISVGNTVIGEIYYALGTSLSLTLYEAATAARVQELVRALTYSSTEVHENPGRVVIDLTDLGGRVASSTVIIDLQGPVVPPVEAPATPTGISATGTSVAEGAASGTSVSVLKAIDANAGDTFTYKLVDDAGGRFALNGNSLVVADGGKLDFEQSTSHSVTVKATDQTGRFVEQRIAIAVSDVATESLKGSSGNDVFVGGGNADQFDGAFGDDKLSGGLGNDILTGDKGRDIFVFDTGLNKKTNVDKIVDFNHRDDTIHLAKSVFSKIAKKGVLSSKAFWVGDKAHDASDRIVYNKKTGALFYDQDGNGAKAAVQFATLPKKLALAANDFFVV